MTAALVEALRTYFGDRASVLGEAAGMHAYVRFSDTDIATRAQRNRVQLREIGPYFLGRAPAHDFLPGFSTVSGGSLREGIKRLAG
jgi:DNA-binding transcriptional MocR family regulator